MKNMVTKPLWILQAKETSIDKAGRRVPNTDKRHMAASAVKEPQQGNAVERTSWGRPGNSQERCSCKGPELGTTNSKVPR